MPKRTAKTLGLSNAQAANALRIWAALGRSQRTMQRRTVKWEAVGQLIRAAERKLVADGEELRTLLDTSRKLLDPFGEPFDLDLGMHRWLASDREEAYSDWLQWIVEQLGIPYLVYRMFSLAPPAGHESWNCSPLVKRELPVPRGHVDCSGRLDLVIRFEGHAIIVVEVKKGSAEDGDLQKHPGYFEWIEQERAAGNGADGVLLVTRGDEAEYGGLRTVTWRHLCIFLRSLVKQNCQHLNHSVKALLLAFASAVEQNLMGMLASHVQSVARGESPLLNPQVVDYLREVTDEGSGP